MAEHIETIESALVAYLASRPFPDSLKNEDGDFRIFPGESDGVKDGQTLIAWVASDLIEEPQYSNNYWSDCEIELRTPINSAVEGDDTVDSLPQHQAAAEVLRSAVMDAGFADALGNSINGFVVYGVLDRNPTRNQNEAYHASGCRFRIYSHPPSF